MKKSYWVLFFLAVIFMVGAIWLSTLASADAQKDISDQPAIESTATGFLPLQSGTADPLGRTSQITQTASGSQRTPGGTQQAVDGPRNHPSDQSGSQKTPDQPIKVTLPKMLLGSAGILREDFEKDSEWVKISGSSPAADSAHVQTGKQSLKVSAGAVKTVVEKKVNWDLAKSVCMRLWVYRETRVNDSPFVISLATNPNFSQYFQYQFTPNPKGWTLVQICRGDFSNVRDAAWDDPVVKIRLQVNPNDEISFDSLTTDVSPIPAIMIDFDDANVSDYTLAYPILKKYGIAATEYVPTSLVGSDGYMTVAQLLELQNSGWTIGNHTVSHILLRDLTAEQQEKEISGALATLEGWGLTGGRNIAYPWGKYNNDTLAILNRWGFTSGRTVSNAPDVFPQFNLFVMRATQDIEGMHLEDVKKMVDAAQRNHRVLILLFHGLHEASGPDDTQWTQANFERLIAYIAEKRIQTLTIAEYVRLEQGSVKVNAPREAK